MHILPALESLFGPEDFGDLASYLSVPGDGPAQAHCARRSTYCSLVVPFVMMPSGEESSLTPASKQRGMTLMDEIMHKATLVQSGLDMVEFDILSYLYQRPPRIASIPTHKTTIHLSALP